MKNKTIPIIIPVIKPAGTDMMLAPYFTCSGTALPLNIYRIN
jgi:hypothetical protein